VNYFYFNSSKFNAGLDHAAAQFGAKRAAAYAALDKELMTKYVPFIPYLVSNNRFLTSSRVKNYLYSSYFNYPVLQALSVG
jgi:peptide/nickel transport system substrate-binding protein